MNPVSELARITKQWTSSASESPILSVSNKYESMVRPGEDSVTCDPLLRCTPYIINTAYMVLICTQCKHGVSLDSASKHVHQSHPQCKLPRTFATELANKFPELVAEKVHPGNRIVEPVFGLAIPLEKFVVCARCWRGYANSGSWRSHACSNPDAPVDTSEQGPNFLSLVQSFFRGPKLCYFPIQTPGTEEESVGDHFALFKTQFRNLDLLDSEDEIEEPENYRELNQFLSKEGWIEHVAGCSKSELLALTALPSCEDGLSAMRPEVLAVMMNIQAIISNSGFHVRRLLGRCPS